MTTATVSIPTQRALELLGQTVVVIGGSAGIGLETARHARTEGAEVILTARNPERLKEAAHELGALSSAAFDASNPDSLARFFDSLSGPIDHVMVGGSGPRYGRPLEMDSEEFRRDGLEARRAELRVKLPIGRVVGPADVAALAVHLMVNTAVTGATYDIDGGQQFVA
jgi:NAD(P)-dependent dehydrogenase (short-subunit alcohol dehydrogenase family)